MWIIIVAIFPMLGKVFESIVYGFLTVQFKGKISLEQHVLLRGRLSSTNPVKFANHAIKVAELDAIYTDMHKAFDRVRHNILVKKLNDLLRHAWMDRFSLKVGSGIPQGSHLGPLIFIFFIEVFKIFKKIPTVLDLSSLQQQNIDALQN